MAIIAPALASSLDQIGVDHCQSPCSAGKIAGL